MDLKFGHVGLFVSDYEKAVDFYCGVLGMKVKSTRTDAQGRVDLAFLEFAPRMYIEIFPKYEKCGPVAGQSYKHVCFIVEDIGAIAGYLIKRGFAVEGPKDTSAGNKMLFVCDPDGNRIEFNQLASGSVI